MDDENDEQKKLKLLTTEMANFRRQRVLRLLRQLQTSADAATAEATPAMRMAKMR